MFFISYSYNIQYVQEMRKAGWCLLALLRLFATGVLQQKKGVLSELLTRELRILLEVVLVLGLGLRLGLRCRGQDHGLHSVRHPFAQFVLLRFGHDRFGI